MQVRETSTYNNYQMAYNLVDLTYSFLIDSERLFMGNGASCPFPYDHESFICVSNHQKSRPRKTCG